jgi:hypothetical protein
MKIFVHPLAAAQFEGTAVGTVVTHPAEFMGALEAALQNYGMPAHGRGFLQLTSGEHSAVLDWVLPGVIARESVQQSEKMIVRHREEDVVVADRLMVSDRLGKAEAVAAVVYTRKAYVDDPETSPEEARILELEGYDFVLVTVLAYKGPKAPPTSNRFVRNLAGGNARYDNILTYIGDVITSDDSLGPDGNAAFILDSLKREAKEIADYEKAWMLVG